MAMKDIYVHLDASADCKRRVDAGVRLAQRLDSRMTGIAVVQRPYVPPYAEVEIGAEILEQHQQAVRDTLEHIGAAFEERTGSAGVDAEWRIVDGEPVGVLSEHCRYGDLLVLSQDADSHDLLPGGHEMPDRVILTAGRPVLVVPNIYDDGEIGRCILVGWDAGRMAARAVHDALPVLQKADKVTIMIANPEPGEDGHGDLPGADLAAHLARHGVNAEADHVTSKDMDIGDLLLSRAADIQADMIVLGAYGHARWRELVLGGVTRHMLDSMPVPVFMSH
ncbi:MAG: universal stress protein [Magnetovibrio sp.]|nr:universal stress protein [Magnetovibrio sp.]